MDTCTYENTPFFTLKGTETWAKVVGVTDGDSLSVVFPVFGDKLFKFNVRLYGIDTSEMKSKNRDMAIKAKARLVQLVYPSLEWSECERLALLSPQKTHKALASVGSFANVTVWLQCLDFDKYGRLLANVHRSPGSQCFSKYLVDERLAYPYYGDKKLDEKGILEVLK